ncbi:MAG: hypothetical protein IKV25_04735 [Clostridia bacterium]|nr:hypothetical protein [Clostridia bacterium]
MANDVTIMKTAIFGGFKKSDVLALIENLQSETADTKLLLDEKRKEVMELREKLDEAYEKLEKLNEVNELLSIKEKENQELLEKLDKALTENKELSDKLVDIDNKSEKLQRAEKQIGAVYIDARRYADDLVENARSKAKDIGAIASQDIKRECIEIEGLLRDVDVISNKFNTSIEQLHRDVYALSSKLNSSASNLLNLHTDLAELSPANFEYNSFSSPVTDTTNVSNDNEDNCEFITISYEE